MVVPKKMLFVSLLGLMVFADVAASLEVASFNIQILGVTKMNKPEVVNILVQILSRYDLILVQEYRDESGKAVEDLLEALNEHVGSNQYTYVIGDRVGRTSSLEQYIYFYKSTMLTVTDSYNWDDSSGDVFEREPYIVKFDSPTTTQKEFAFVNMHVKPDDAVNEIDYLTDVYDDAFEKYEVPIIVSGDLNADCTYVHDDDWANIRLRSDSWFHWIIPDSADTTVSSTDCAYDRWVVDDYMKDLITGPNVFYFDAYYGLTDEKAKDVSDHYPVEMTIN